MLQLKEDLRVWGGSPATDAAATVSRAPQKASAAAKPPAMDNHDHYRRAR